MGMSPSTSRGAPGKGAPMTARSMQYQPADMAGTSQYGNMAGFSGGIGAFRQPFTRNLPSGYDPNVHQPSIGFMPGFEGMQASASGPSTIPAGMQGDQLREQQPATSEQPNMSIDGAIPRSAFGGIDYGPMRAAQPLRQINDMGFAQPAVMPPSGTFGQSAQRPQAMTIDEFRRSPLMGPTTQEVRMPIEFEGGMYDPVLVSRYEQYRSGVSQQPMQLESSQDFMARMNQARQAGLQVGPTPNQPPNPYTGMSPVQLQQMNELIRMKQMQAAAAARNQVPMQYRPPMQQPMMQPYQQRVQPNMFGGLAALMPFLRRQY